MNAPASQTPPAVCRLGNGRLLLSGAALLDALRLVLTGLRVAGRDGISPSPRIRELVDALEAGADEVAAMSARGLADVRKQASLTTSLLPAERLTTAEVAERMNVAERTVRRYAQPGGSLTNVGTRDRMRFDAVEVAALQLRRNERSLA